MNTFQKLVSEIHAYATWAKISGPRNIVITLLIGVLLGAFLGQFGV